MDIPPPHARSGCRGQVESSEGGLKVEGPNLVSML